MGKGTKRPDGIAMALMEVPIEKLSEHPDNPRKITAEKLADLKRSIQSIPAMLYKRPLVVITHGEGYQVLGGNQRLKALKDLGYDMVPVMLADDLTEEQRREFIVKDNVGFGEWDWDALANEWDGEQLADWGLDGAMGPLDVRDIEEMQRDEFKITIHCKDEQEYDALVERIGKQPSGEKILSMI